LMGAGVLADPFPLSPEYVPESLVGRDRELGYMRGIFLPPALDGRGSPLALVIGHRGSGKTALLKLFKRLVEAEGAERGRPIKCAYVSCWGAGGRLFRILERALRALGAAGNLRGRSSAELFGFIEGISSRGIFPILLLDDAEAILWAEGADPIYALSRAAEGAGVRGLGLVLSFGGWDRLAGIDGSALSALRRGAIELRGYSRAELREILAQRASMALRKGAIEGEALDLIADASSGWGDAGFAIRSLGIAAEIAEREGAASVAARHAERAVEEASSSPDPQLLGELSEHERLFLAAIGMALGRRGSGEVPMGEAESEYRVLCERFGIAPRRHTQLWKYARRLSIVGLLSLRPSGAGFKGRTTLIGLRSLRWDKVINYPRCDGDRRGT